MRVVVQNGANHCLSRKDAEAVVSLLPRAWNSGVAQVLLASGSSLLTSFHRKERVVCLYCPSSPLAVRDKRTAVSLLLRAIAGAADAELPEGLEQQCHEAVNVQAA